MSEFYRQCFYRFTEQCSCKEGSCENYKPIYLSHRVDESQGEAKRVEIMEAIIDCEVDEGLQAFIRERAFIRRKPNEDT